MMLSLLAGCLTTDPSLVLAVDGETQLARRQIETRRYDGIKEEALLVASANVLQDMGFILEQSETKLGVLMASKKRDASNVGQMALSVLVAIFTKIDMGYDEDQTIRVSLVARPVQQTGNKRPTDSHFVRVTFQRVVRKSDKSQYIETLNDESLYVAFFDQLSKSIFLEAQKI
jgi:hypothetical protein